MAGHKWANIKHRKGACGREAEQKFEQVFAGDYCRGRRWAGRTRMNLRFVTRSTMRRPRTCPRTRSRRRSPRSGQERRGQLRGGRVRGLRLGGVAVMLDCLTDNKNWTVPEVRKILRRTGNLGSSGCVAYNFGEGTTLRRQGADEEAVMNARWRRARRTCRTKGEGWEIVCEPSDYVAKCGAAGGCGFHDRVGRGDDDPDDGGVHRRDAEKVMNLIEALEDHDDVQKVHANFDIPDEEMEKLQG
ncbi:MAG: YebC/PmpR family DNA-binding transcriptional regulator [Phycisphaerales bacterium]